MSTCWSHCFHLTLALCSLSLGCGIGYGYLHRIPTLPFAEGRKISFPAHIPNPPLKDGFTEVVEHLFDVDSESLIFKYPVLTPICCLPSSPFSGNILFGYLLGSRCIFWVKVIFWFPGPSHCCDFHDSHHSFCCAFCLDWTGAESGRPVSQLKPIYCP